MSTPLIVSFLNTGRVLKPYSPVLLRGGRDGDGNIILQWTRRSRLNNVPFWADMPLGESIERYRVLVYDDDTYAVTVLTYTVDVQTATVPIADQTTAFGGAVAAGGLYWDVAQLGDLGYGYAARGVI